MAKRAGDCGLDCRENKEKSAYCKQESGRAIIFKRERQVGENLPRGSAGR
jgi:hypothetical protein